MYNLFKTIFVILIGPYVYFVANCLQGRCYFFPDALHNGLSFVFIIQGHNIIIVIINVPVNKNNNGRQPAALCNLSITIFKCIIRYDESDLVIL